MRARNIAVGSTVKDQRGNKPAQPVRARVIAEIAGEVRRRGGPYPGDNTFKAKPQQGDYGRKHSLATSTERLAATPQRATSTRPRRQQRWVAGALVPTTQTLSLSPSNDPAFREVILLRTVKAVYREQVDAG